MTSRSRTPSSADPTRRPIRPAWALALFCLVLFVGCGPLEPRDSGPSRPPPGLDDIPEPKPGDEPRSRYGNPDSYTVLGRTYRVMDSAEGYRREGIASWYGEKFHGKRTSSGEPYDMYALTAAHTTLPLPTHVRVTNLENDRSIIVRVNDRGPFKDNRLIDLSYAAAYRLGFLDSGTARVRVEALTGNSEGDGQVRVQVGAFRDAGNARALRRRLENRGIDAVGVNEADGGVYRVQVGPVREGEALERLLGRLARAGFHDTSLVRE